MAIPTPTVHSPAKRRWLRRTLAWSGLLLLPALGGLVAEHWRGQLAMRAWRQEWLARGESLDPAALWPKPDEQARQFTRELNQLANQLPAELQEFGGQLS